MFNEFPYTNYEKINLDWLLDLGNKLKADAESGAFDGERGPGIFGITNIYAGGEVGGPGYYCNKIGDAGVDDFVIGYGPAAGSNILYLMKVTRVSGNYLEGTTLLQITGPRGEQGPQGEPGAGGLTEAMKQALLQLARKVVYVDTQGQSYYQALYNAFYPPADLSSISAIYTQSGTVYDTDTLDSLKTDLIVTAHYSDSTSAVVTDYTLTGTLSEGTSVVTVSYGGKTTTFNVTVTHNEQPVVVLSSITAVFNQGNTIVYDTDSLDSLKPMLSVTAHYSDNTSAVVTDYTLTGTLSEGTSVVTVSYGGKTTTFDVTVSVAAVLSFVTGKVNSALPNSNVVTRDGTTYTIIWNPDYAGTQSFQNTRVYLEYPTETGKTYHVNLHSSSQYYIFETDSDALVSNGGTLNGSIHSGSEDVTFTATKTGTLIRFAFITVPATLNNPTITEVTE